PGRIPHYLPAHEHRNQAQVDGNGGMVRSFDWADGRLAGSDAINEVPGVVVRFVEPNLRAFRQLGEPIQGGSIVPAAVHTHPALGPNPLGARTDIRMATGDDHRDVVRILAGIAILRAGIPDRVFRRELTLPFDFAWPRVVKVQPPMRDVTVMANPVQELAPSDVVIPAPVHVDASLDVRFHPRRADPKLVIQFGRWLAGHHPRAAAREIGMTAWQANLDAHDLADEAVADDFCCPAESAL